LAAVHPPLHRRLFSDEAPMRIVTENGYPPATTGTSLHIRVERTLDIECYQNYFLVRVEDVASPHAVHRFVLAEGVKFDRTAFDVLAQSSTFITFNGNNYDMPMLMLALAGATNAELKLANNQIIERGLKPWDFYRSYQLSIPGYYDHIDIMEVAPGVHIGLKMYAGRIHAPKMQDLPIEPSQLISMMDRVLLDTYCGNDHDVTRRLYFALNERLALRKDLGERYKIDVRSKSDAQIAESVIKSQLDFYPEKRYIPHGYSFKYTPPEYIRYVTAPMRELLEVVRASEFVVTDKEEALEMYGDATGIRTGVNIPKELKGRDIRIGRSVYRLGIGGLHSQEHSVSHATDDKFIISDHDVASYYPSLILGMEMYPEQIGPAFLTIYRKVYDRRLEAKEAGRKTEADGLKIVLNGTFGKLFSKYSILYAPEFGIRTTLSGQLALLMLIEMLELSGIQVVSANTDGIVLKTPRDRVMIRDEVIAWWEKTTALKTEASFYRSIHQRDVNNYIAITEPDKDGKIKAKRKGVFAPPGVIENKHPDKAICAEAVVALLKDGVPIIDTIRGCTDIRQFLVVRAVKGGGIYKGEFLGKAVRWYYGGAAGHIEYKSNGNKVATSDGATPIMQLPETLPTDIHYQHYIDAAERMLEDIGMGIPF
jgi:hypothetical protein